MTIAENAALHVSGASASPMKRAKQRARTRRWQVFGCQILFLSVILAGWQFVPQIKSLRKVSHVFDPYFVSAPRRIGESMFNLATGRHESVVIWGYIWQTMYAAVLGTVIGISLGAMCGLVLSNSAFASAVLRPFVVAANATPRVALIPIVVIVFGVSQMTSIMIAVLVVFFVAFFNAYEGGTSIPPHIIQNATLLGGSKWRVLRYVRLPYALAWTITGLPLAATFAIISVVTGEILTGYHGTGYLLSTADTTGDSSLTFAVVFYLAAVGLLVVIFAEALRRRIIHWWAR
jgi:NitT/TauT family transport system permease protein